MQDFYMNDDHVCGVHFLLYTLIANCTTFQKCSDINSDIHSSSSILCLD